MSFQVVDLPSVTMSSGATRSPAWTNLDDASIISIAVSGTTAPGLQVHVELTATGTNFKPLVFPSSGAGIVTASSSYVLQVFGGGYRQMCVATTAASTGGMTVSATKWINVIV